MLAFRGGGPEQENTAPVPMFNADCTLLFPQPFFALGLLCLLPLTLQISIVNLVLLEGFMFRGEKKNNLKVLFQLLLQIKINEVADVNGLCSLS